MTNLAAFHAIDESVPYDQLELTFELQMLEIVAGLLDGLGEVACAERIRRVADDRLEAAGLGWKVNR